ISPNRRITRTSSTRRRTNHRDTESTEKRKKIEKRRKTMRTPPHRRRAKDVAAVPCVLILFFSSLCSLCLCGSIRGADEPRHFVALDKDGKLHYEADARGNRIPDFSHCGYLGGGVALPDAPVRAVVAPAKGDNGPRIQAAIDYVSQLPADGK